MEKWGFRAVQLGRDRIPGEVNRFTCLSLISKAVFLAWFPREKDLWSVWLKVVPQSYSRMGVGGLHPSRLPACLLEGSWELTSDLTLTGWSGKVPLPCFFSSGSFMTTAFMFSSELFPIAFGGFFYSSVLLLLDI